MGPGRWEPLGLYCVAMYFPEVMRRVVSNFIWEPWIQEPVDPLVYFADRAIKNESRVFFSDQV